MSKRSQSGRNRQASKSSSSGNERWVWVVVLLGGAIIVAGVVFGGGSLNEGAATDRDPAAIAEGEALFTANCAACHGADLNGTATGPPFLNAIYAPNHHGAAAFQQAVAVGVQPHHWDFGPMPPVEGLTAEDVDKIVEFVRSRQEAEGIFRDPTHG